MLTFIQFGPRLPSSSPSQCLRPNALRVLAPQRRKARPAYPAKRVRMAVNDRSTEFSLGESDESQQRASDASTANDLADWDDWRLTGRPMTVPAIPFPPVDIFLPGETKRLHLFEARYLALFENVVVQYDKRCAHILIDSARRAMAAFGTISHVRSWRRLDVGVSVEFEAVGRLKMKKLYSAAPFLRGDFEFVEDDLLEGADSIAEVSQLEVRFWTAFREVVSLCVKLGEDPIRNKVDTATATIDAVESKGGVARAPGRDTLGGDNNVFLLSSDAKKEMYEQKLKQAAKRAVNFEELDFASEEVSNEIVLRRARALSFAGWDFFPSTPGMRQKALEQRNTLARLQTVVTALEERSRKLAAKLALENVFSE